MVFGVPITLSLSKCMFTHCITIWSFQSGWRTLHSSCALTSRIKTRFTHKPFWHIKKTAKQPDEPLTLSNQEFVNKYSQELYSKSPLRGGLLPWCRGKFSPGTRRCGLLGKKIGILPIWTKQGVRIESTLIQIEDVHVIKYITPEEFSTTIMAEKRLRPRIYLPNRSISLGCLVVGSLSADPTKFTKDYCGLFTATGLAPKKKLARFPVTQNAVIQPGTQLFASHFTPGQYVDVAGTTIRRGFQGVMKRWGFSGMNATHGVTKSHRRPGHIGSGCDKSRVWPGQKMPGHVGGHKRIQRGLRVLRINYEENVLWITGQAIPGENGDFVQIFDTVISGKTWQATGLEPRFFPTCYEDQVGQLPNEEYCDSIHHFDANSITFA